MQNKCSRSPHGDASSACVCGAFAHPAGAGVTEHHADRCPLLDASRARRIRDLATLAEHPDGWTFLRPIADSERAEAEDAADAMIPAGRRARRRWSAEVRLARLAGRDALVRVFRLDGEPRGVIIDETSTGAGAG